MSGGAPRPDPQQGKTSLLRSLRAVAWSLIGLRAGDEYQRDLQSIQPLHVLLIGLIALFAFVLILIGIVKWVT